MKQTNFIAFAFVFLLALSFTSAVYSINYNSPINSSVYVGVSPSFNATIDVVADYNVFILNGVEYASETSGSNLYVSSASEFNEGLNNWSALFNVGGVDVIGTTQYFYYDTTAPIVTVPTNIVQVAPSASGDIITFNVSADESSIVICTPASGSTFVVGETIVTCSATDSAGNIGTNNFTVTLTYTAPATGGSGGSGACTTAWTCNEWSECDGGSQTRTCTYPTNYCTPKSDKPLELRTCTVSAPVTTNTTELGGETQPTFTNLLTGNVIGTTAGRISLGVIAFIIILGLAWWIVAAKKRRAALDKPVKTAKLSAKKK